MTPLEVLQYNVVVLRLFGRHPWLVPPRLLLRFIDGGSFALLPAAFTFPHVVTVGDPGAHTGITSGFLLWAF